MSGIEMVNEIPAVMEEATMADAPGEVYEPVQTLKLRLRPFEVETEDEKIYIVDEIYCNVPVASRCVAEIPGHLDRWFECVGRLTIAGGVAYVDVG